MSYIGNSPGVASQRVETTFTATASQTVFTPSSGYTLGYCDVYQNGVKLVNGDDYSAPDGVSITLTTGAAAGDSIVIVASFPRGLSDGYLKSEADAKYLTIANPSYTGTLTGGTGLINLGSGQLVKDTSGNLGVGVTPSAWSSATGFQVQNAAIEGRSSLPSYGTFSANGFTQAGTWKYISSDYASRYTQYQGAHLWLTAASGTAGNAITFTQAMTLDASGNLGVGTTSPNTQGFGKAIEVSQSTSSALTITSSTNNFSLAVTASENALRFYAAGSEKMRMDSSGNLLVGTTTALGKQTIYTASGTALYFDNAAATGGFTTFRYNSSVCGSITTAGAGTTSYNTSSDERLKEDQGVATETSVIDNTIIHNFVWKQSGAIDRGVFAQEAHQTKPEAVHVGSDDIDEEGRLTNPWGVDYSKYVPDLIIHGQQLKKQIQEQQALIQQLQADVATLKGTA